MPEQTILYDDFEQSLIEEGIEMIVPETEEDPPEGTGASGYTPRTTAPSETNPYYLKRGRGGYNRCILIQGNSCLPNCVGFAWGRTVEIGGVTDNEKLPTCNAEDWFETAKNRGFKTGSKPQLGAVIVWKSGNLHNGADGCGHVGIVEKIYSDGSILVSQSNYGGTRFFLTTIKKPYNIYGQTFLGFIYNPYYKRETGWHQTTSGKWYYEHEDGSVTRDAWEKIDGKWYHFDKNGFMQTGWLKDKDGKWYYLSSSGAMVTGWLKDKGKWYYLSSSGAMVKGWVEWKDKLYYLDTESGAMLIGDHVVLAHFDETGAFVPKNET